MTSQSTKDELNGDLYAIYRVFTTFGENSLQTQFSYFQERYSEIGLKLESKLKLNMLAL